MKDEFFPLDKIKKNNDRNRESYRLLTISRKDIAVIGMSGKIGSAADLEALWINLQDSKDMIHDFPETRKSNIAIITNAVRKVSNVGENEYKYIQGGFLDSIDEFDYTLFDISPKDANLIDPNQRLFLETAWSVLEDAGYGGKRLQKTKTGVYVGYSNDFGEEYKQILKTTNPSSLNLATTGNIKSIIASRISYIMDFKGPSIVVDTACSSSLVAIHLACQGIRNNECDYAIAGGVKVRLFPVQIEKDEETIGIESSDGRTSTFDDSSDGTGMGEGVGAVLLKSLSKAIADGDNIYAVIKGSAINQDGKTMGITAPNSSAQEDVILDAWKDADIDPKTISYIEAHGTGTKLGDPIEVSGIERAFTRYTDRKQFCAIGSIKSNVGHLDSAAGIAAFIKVVLALKNKQIPASLHFRRPNQKIQFVDSPVYVNDKLVYWKENETPRRCGVSSFGLSGTNCHIILEEAPKPTALDVREEISSSLQILKVSAKSKDSLIRLLRKYLEFLKEEQDDRFADICYTANIGRGDYSYRIIILASSVLEVRNKILSILQLGLDGKFQNEVMSGQFWIVPDTQKLRGPYDITEEEKRSISNQVNILVNNKKSYYSNAILKQISELYVQGADVDWKVFYEGDKRNIIPLPTYQFQKNFCFLIPEESDMTDSKQDVKESIHPLIDKCLVESDSIAIYQTIFSKERQWELSEHRIFNNYVLPGTAYLEIATTIAKHYYGDHHIELRDVAFLSPLIVSEGKEIEVHSIVKVENGFLEFKIVGYVLENWIQYVVGKIYCLNHPLHELRMHLDEIKIRLNKEKNYDFSKMNNNGSGVQVGPRFLGLRSASIGVDEALALIELPNEYRDDLKHYRIHPSLMDSAVNMANPSIGEGVYLPLYYSSLKIYGATPHRFYSYIKRIRHGKESIETGNFNITMMDESGSIFAEANGYTVKRALESEFQKRKHDTKALNCYKGVWVQNEILQNEPSTDRGTILVFKGKGQLCKALVQKLYESDYEIIEVEFGNKYEKINEKQYRVSTTLEDYSNLMKSLKEKKFVHILHLLTSSGYEENEENFQRQQEIGMLSLFYLTRAMIQCKINGGDSINLVLVSNYTTSVTGDEKEIYPLHTAMFGLAKVVMHENPNINCRCIDIDDDTTEQTIMDELNALDSFNQVAYRHGKRYNEEFVEIKDIEQNKVEFRNHGVYLIAGGNGGIGHEIAKHIATKGNINIAILGRSYVPSSSEWENVLRNGMDSKTCKKIIKLKELEQLGVHVEYIQTDISKNEDMKKAITYLREKYESINGVIHCAGVTGNGFLFRKSEDEFKKVIAPKVQGTWLLDKYTRNDNLDFFILFSSITALVGDIGQGDYAAANSFMDAYAIQRKKHGLRSLSINWPAWDDVGMAVENNALKENPLFAPVHPSEGIQFLDKMFSSDLVNVIAGKLNPESPIDDSSQLPMRFSKNVNQKQLRNDVNLYSEKKSKPVVSLEGRITGEYSVIEQKLSVMWAEVLGLKEININANFSEIGGNSISATILLKEMKQEYAEFVNISDIFTYPSIAEMALYLEKEIDAANHPEKKIEYDNSDNSNNEDMENILTKLASGEIDIGDVKSLLS